MASSLSPCSGTMMENINLLLKLASLFFFFILGWGYFVRGSSPPFAEPIGCIQLLCCDDLLCDGVGWVKVDRCGG